MPEQRYVPVNASWITAGDRLGYGWIDADDLPDEATGQYLALGHGDLTGTVTVIEIETARDDDRHESLLRLTLDPPGPHQLVWEHDIVWLAIGDPDA